MGRNFRGGAIINLGIIMGTCAKCLFNFKKKYKNYVSLKCNRCLTAQQLLIQKQRYCVTTVLAGVPIREKGHDATKVRR